MPCSRPGSTTCTSKLRRIWRRLRRWRRHERQGRRRQIQVRGRERGVDYKADGGRGERGGIISEDCFTLVMRLFVELIFFSPSKSHGGGGNRKDGCAGDVMH